MARALLPFEERLGIEVGIRGCPRRGPTRSAVMRGGIGLSSLIRLATLAALGVWLLGGCASTSPPLDTRVDRSDAHQTAPLFSLPPHSPHAGKPGLSSP